MRCLGSEVSLVNGTVIVVEARTCRFSNYFNMMLNNCHKKVEADAMEIHLPMYQDLEFDGRLPIVFMIRIEKTQN